MGWASAVTRLTRDRFTVNEPMAKTIDLTGQQFGSLTVIRLEGKTRYGHTLWLCACECGATSLAKIDRLRSGKTQSCGCKSKTAALTHGFTRHPLFITWKGIAQRCENPRATGYHRYGGRGIKCLLPSPQALEDAIGPRPSPRHSVDRINNDGDYEAGNLRWASCQEQGRNRRGNRLLTWQGRTQCLMDWADECNIDPRTLSYRLANGWSVEQALSEPVAIRS
jgi:hypothetical protein